MLTSETKRRIDNCRDILVGKLPQPSNQVELITLALIYKFMDDLDEESVKLGGKRSFFVKDLAKYRWRNLLPQTVSADERVTLFSEGVEALGHAKKAAHLPGLFRDIFRNSFLKFRDGRILTMFLTEVNGFAYSHSEELGNAFEYLLQCTGAQGENGQFRTPRHIIDFIVACLDPQPGDKILDPACGTGGFLVSAYRRILAKHTSAPSSHPSPPVGEKVSEGRMRGNGVNQSVIPGDLLTFAQRQQVYKNLAGYDVDDQMVKLSKVNLFLHGFPDPAIHIYDTLSNDARWHEKADLILANPPFMTPKGGVTPHTKFRIAAKKAEVLFTDYIAEHLSGDGRGGIIVPNGIVATTQNAYVKLRRYLVEDSLVAVVSLPAGVFKPYSGVKTSILLLDKKLARQTKEILFLKITADGFDLGDKRNPIAANDLPEAERVVKAWLKGRLNDEFRMTSATGAIGSTKGTTPSQPGATPQVTDTQNISKGQRPAPSQQSAADGSGLQPSEMFLNDAPGALPQAGMGSAVGAQGQRPASSQPGPTAQESESAPAMRAESPAHRIVWNVVAKSELLEHRACSLQVEAFVGGEVAASDCRMVSFEDLCVRMQYGLSVPLNIHGIGTPCFRMNEIPGGVATDAGTMKRAKISTADSAKYRLNRGDLLFNRTNSFEHVGRTGIFDLPGDYVFASYLIRLEIKRELADPRYVNAFMNSAKFQEGIKSRASRAVNQANISASALAGYEIPLPPLEEQRRIVAEIEGYQKVLDGARQILDALEHQLHIEPDWELVPFGTICENLDGKRRPITKSDRKPGPYPYYGASGIVDSVADYIFDEPLLLVSEDGANLLARSTPIAFSVSGKIWVNNHAHVVRFPDMATQRFVEHYLNSISIANYVTGAAQPKLNQAQLNSIEIPLPPLEEQRRLVAELDAEAAQMGSVRSLLPRFEAKIQRVLDRVWGNTPEATA